MPSLASEKIPGLQELALHHRISASPRLRPGIRALASQHMLYCEVATSREETAETCARLRRI